MQRRTLLKSLSFAAVPPVWHKAKAQAPAYPSRPITLVVPSAAGGQSDLIARYLGVGLSKALGQPVVVDNRAGGSGIIGLQYATKRPADGYTLTYGVASWMAVNPAFFRALPYDPERDFTAITQIGTAPQALLIGAHVPARTFAEFVAHAKAQPGSVSYASFGNGTTSHLQGELLKQVAGIDMLHVPFKGAAQALQEVAAGRVDSFIIDFSAASGFIKDGRLLPLALTGSVRSPAFPEVATFKELGCPLTLVGWNGIFTNAGTPPEIVARLNQTLNGIIQSADGRIKLEQLGLLPTGSTPEALQKILHEDIDKWRAVVRRAGIKSE